MSIKEVEQLNLRQAETLKRKHAREVANLQEAHQNYKAELKKSNEDEIIDLQDQHLHQIAKESDKKEKVLSKMHSHLEDTRRMTDKELKNLVNHNESFKARERERLSSDRDKAIADHELYLEEIKDRYSDQIKKTNADGQTEVLKLTQNKAQEVSDKESFYQEKLGKQTNDFNNRFKTDENLYQKFKDDQDRQFKNQRLNTNQRQQTEIAKLTTTHSKTIEDRDENFRKGLKNQDLMFEQKYAANLKTSNEHLKNLNEKQQQLINKMKNELHEKLQTSESRSEDPFYRFTELKPMMVQFPDRVEITVNIPEYAKENVQLSFNNKEAIINFNRRYDDSKKDGDHLSKLHKVESFTTRLKTDHVLDPKSVKSSYENGEMKYVILKS
jgi:HSP20 family molecular chaperone IbpA